MTYHASLDDLFIRWQVVERGTPFIKEFLTDETMWEKASLRLMVIMKEAVSAEEFEYQQFIQDGGYLRPGEGHTWAQLIRWIYGILHDFPPYTSIETRAGIIREQARDFFKQVYFTNVKKIAGGPRADDTALWESGISGQRFLLEQIEIVKPSLVLCCGPIVYDILHAALREQKETFIEGRTEGGLWYIEWHNTKIVRFYHPNSQFPRDMTYTYLAAELPKVLV